MEIRRYRTEDLDKIVQLFYDTVNTINIRDYTSEQVAAWSSARERLLRSNDFFMSLYTLAAVEGEHIIGYGNIDRNGYLDHLFVHKDRQGIGVATAICDKLERYAKECNCKLITVHASVTAKPFFERRGYSVVKENTVEIDGVKLRNYFMEKEL